MILFNYSKGLIDILILMSPKALLRTQVLLHITKKSVILDKSFLYIH